MSKILFGVSGSIAAMKAAQVVSSLVQKGHEVQVVTTPSALRFVGTATWEGLTGRPALSDVFSEGHQMDHIHLARWADLYLMCPASANAIANWAHGLASDLPSALHLAFEKDKPVYLAPAMNREMWTHPAVQKNLSILRSWNVRVIEPDNGSLACGENGPGRLAAPEKILATLEAPSSHRGRILVTSGATREAIDGVRFLTNVSSGKTGASLADAFTADGWQVTYLHGRGAQLPVSGKVRQVGFNDFQSLQSILQTLLREQRFAAIVHAAAVSDFSVAEISASGAAALRTGGKLSSDQDLHLRLKRNPKLVFHLKEWSQPHSPFVVAFKLTDTPEETEQKRAVQALLDRTQVDAVVWNNLSDVGDNRHSGKVFAKASDPVAFSDKADLGKKLISLLGRIQ